MAQIVTSGKINIIEGTEEQIADFRHKLHELGLDIERSQFIEFISQDIQEDNNQNVNPVSSTATNLKSVKPETHQTESKPANQNSETKAAPNAEPSNSLKLTDFQIENGENGFLFHFPDSVKEKIWSLFGRKRNIKLPDPAHEGSSFFLGKINDNLIEYALHPAKYDNPDEQNQNLLKALKIFE